MADIEKAMDLRPAKVKERLGSEMNILLMNSKDILNALYEQDATLMTCNARIKHVVPGIMRAAEELDAVVGFELAKSEGHIDGGYTGQTPEIFFTTVTEYAKKLNFSKPFFIHGDHIKVPTTSLEDIESARKLIEAELDAGYTSFAIDASYNEINDNIRITLELAKPIIENGLGLEVEIGEIKSKTMGGVITTVEEAEHFISKLIESGVSPNLLAINNGSKHGNYDPGEDVSINLKRTREIFDALSEHRIGIAQHGITGTPPDIMKKFPAAGIKKGNVGTKWQNIALESLPQELLASMKDWAESEKKNIKHSIKPFKEKIDSIPDENCKQIEQNAYETAKDIIKTFNAVGTASKIIEEVESRE